MRAGPRSCWAAKWALLASAHGTANRANLELIVRSQASASSGLSARLKSGGWVPKNSWHPILHDVGMADSVALGPTGEAAQSAWPLSRPDSTVVAVAAEIHCQSHGRSLQAFLGFDQPSVIYGRHPLDTFLLLPKSMVSAMIIHWISKLNQQNLIKCGVAQYAQHIAVQPTKLRTGQLLDSFMLHHIDTQC